MITTHPNTYTPITHTPNHTFIHPQVKSIQWTTDETAPPFAFEIVLPHRTHVLQPLESDTSDAKGSESASLSWCHHVLKVGRE